jgi:membrane protein insertase Oxa1/YidC/SpoIIIJ
MKNMKALTPEMEALKAKLKATWISGDFGQIAKSYLHYPTQDLVLAKFQ